MLDIENVHISVEDKKIVEGLNLRVGAGEVHMIMGPNGIGKSTLVHMLAGHPFYKVLQGTITFQGKDLLAMTPQKRAHEGLFIGFQHPVEISGMNTFDFLYKVVLMHKPVTRKEFENMLYGAAELVGMNSDCLKRDFNLQFSGGEKKRNELLQLLLVQPKLAVLDEIDSGLDVDAIRALPKIIQKDSQRAYILITHNRLLFEKVLPDFVHIMDQGHIVRTGDIELAEEVFEKGFQPINPE
ncbi:MAG: Fe-S cluster assembly ATPase SufC [Parachlamydiales bacterium]|nr:Fe-S cluster assembly ATPase SufC [Parachlamydiales bacterium]